MQKLLRDRITDTPKNTPHVLGSVTRQLNSSDGVRNSATSFADLNNNPDEESTPTRTGGTNLRVSSVYVLNLRGEPLMPTTPQKARKLLKSGKAKVVQRTPFTIRLLYTTGENIVNNKKNKELSARTVNKIITVLKMLFKQAEEWGNLQENPARFIKRSKQERKEMDYLNREEIQHFLDAAAPDYYALFFTAVFSGARQGELLGLRWGDVDLEKRVIYIRRTYDAMGYREPKTKAGKRAIAITSELVKVLSEHKETLKNHGDNDPVFQNKKGKPINKANVISREFHPALERAGIRRIRFHDLRHTYGAIMATMGEYPKFIQRQMGHSALSVTMDNYGHLMPEVDEGFRERFDSFVLKK